MRGAARILFLIPLGILFGAIVATLVMLVLGANIPDFGEAFISAFIAAWKAFWAAFVETDDVDAPTRVLMRLWSLMMLILLAPVFVTAVIAELARMRGALVHMVLAGALTLLFPAAAGAPLSTATPAEQRAIACLFFTGAAAGFAYWLVAGRRRDEQPPAATQAS
ncbi:hypothetical protein [Terrarubrum flagellatum]|uniref:hypothetical protein n=1 Tax=Terrirubrum flagellatum TaxID=2895980 RepID=UPI0031455AD8